MTDRSFGTQVTPHMLVQKFEGDVAHAPEITPYRNLELSPLAKSLHYGQSVFEGMKAYRVPGGEIALFRPRDHLARLQRSAARLCLPQIDIEQVLRASTP